MQGEGGRWEWAGFLEAESFILEHHGGLQKRPGFWVKKMRHTKESVNQQSDNKISGGL